MAIAGYFSYIGAYEDLGEASADYQAVKNLRSGVSRFRWCGARHRRMLSGLRRSCCTAQ
jgi:hypothetical protein